MTIDKEKLIELLVEKTSMDEVEIKTQLDQLIERIIDAAKRGKALAIKEFGVFYFDENGELRFDASDELSTEISFKYAGMKPVELKPERDTSFPDGDTAESDQETEEEVTFADEELSEPNEEVEDPRGVSDSEEEADKEEPPFEADSDDEVESIEKPAEDESVVKDPFYTEDPGPTEETEEKETETEKAGNVKNVKSVSRKPVKKKDHSGIFILIAIVVIAVLIGSYFYYIGTQSQDNSQTSDTTNALIDPGIDEEGATAATNEMGTTESQLDDAEPGSVEQSVNGNESEGEQAISNQSTDQENDTDGTLSASETDQSLYGLTGSVIEEANNGYSIVIHSFRAEQTALETAEQLREDGYRVIVLTRTVSGSQVWRVSVGQFETLTDAQQATVQLPEPYNSQNFIQRIRIN